MTTVSLGAAPHQIRVAASRELAQLQAIDAAAAAALFVPLGLHTDLSAAHPFAVSERDRWATALERGLVLVTLGPADMLTGFAVMGEQDGLPYLDQLVVHPSYMRRGLGSALLRSVIATHRTRPLWLTTYAHVPWNAPYYMRFGFRVVPEVQCGPELLLTLATQRAALPAPEQRVAMVRDAAPA